MEKVILEQGSGIKHWCSYCGTTMTDGAYYRKGYQFKGYTAYVKLCPTCRSAFKNRELSNVLEKLKVIDKRRRKIAVLPNAIKEKIPELMLDDLREIEDLRWEHDHGTEDVVDRISEWGRRFGIFPWGEKIEV